MSKRAGNVIIISSEAKSTCQECGKVEECRPYGRGGASICYDCAIRIEHIINHNMRIKLFGKKGKLK